MRSLLLLLVASLLASCISFPRAQVQARERNLQGEQPADGTEPVGDIPAVKTRDNFKDRYFR